MARTTFLVLAACGACGGPATGARDPGPEAPPPSAPAEALAPSAPAAPPTVEDPHLETRQRMVRETIEARGVRDPRVLEAMRVVPRHHFVPEDRAAHAYADRPLTIGHDQTISQPYVVALMTELVLGDGEIVREGRPMRVLEIGTGSGYQAAVLAQLGVEVYSIEIVEPLAQRAASALAELGYRVHTRHGDGYRGWPEHAPFDTVLLTAAPPEIPAPLIEQLAVGGRLVAPVGGAGNQELVVLHKTAEGIRRERVGGVRFVPMTGEAQR